MSIFTCCEREDETKYIHPCACPSASVVCESEEINAALCGFSEYSGFSSFPPLKYRVEEWSGQIYAVTDIGGIGIDLCGYGTRGRKWAGSKLVSALDCSSSDTRSADSYSDAVETSTGFPCANSGNPGACTPPSTRGGNYFPSVTFSTISATLKEADPVTTSLTICEESAQKELKVLDTEQDAIDRETPVTGTSCSSLWETRSTGFSFIDRTSGYTIECSDLIVGLEYEVTPSIRKRTAVIGSYGAWEDVTVSSTSFTATATTETIDSSGNPIALDHIQGYEYEITGANIEKKA